MIQKIKNFLKRILPPPVRAFNREVERILSAIRQQGDRLNAETGELRKEQQVLHQQLQAIHEDASAELREIRAAQRQALTELSELQEAQRQALAKLSELQEAQRQATVELDELRGDQKQTAASLDRLLKDVAELRKQARQHERNIFQKLNQEKKEFFYEYHSRLDPKEYEKELALWYRAQTGEDLDLENPQTYNAKIQWLKLYDSTPLKTRLTDKYLVRDWVKEKIGEEYLIPLLGVWDSFDEIDFNALPDQFVLKANHGSGWNVIVKDKVQFDPNAAKAKLNFWLGLNFAFRFGLELHYMNIPQKIIAEKYIEEIDQVYDYKFMCFDGNVKFIWVDTDRFTDHKRTLFTTDWKRRPERIAYDAADYDIPKPKCLDQMISFAETLSQGFAHVRVDFYEVNGRLYFGEMTFTSTSGTDKIVPPEFNLEMGQWLSLPEKSPIPTRGRQNTI